MQIDLIFDTETTGRVQHKSHFSDERQPHPVQIGALLVAGDKEIASMNTLVQLPDGVDVEQGAQEVHGISKERCMNEGIPPHEAYEKFFKMIVASDNLVAHNLSFDLMVMRSLWYRNQKRIAQRTERENEKMANLKYICTMKTLTNVLKLKGRYGYKWPKLEEAYKLLVDPEGFDGAHDAFVDVRACRMLLGVIREKGYPITGE